MEVVGWEDGAAAGAGSEGLATQGPSEDLLGEVENMTGGQRTTRSTKLKTSTKKKKKNKREEIVSSRK